MNQEHYRSDDNMRSWCHFHPTQFVIGICALCLNEKLLILAAKQGSLHQTHKITQKKAKVVALTSLRNLLETKQHRPNHQNCHSSSTSPEDSFISIKFEDNGVASWDKGKVSETPLDDCSWDKAKKIKSVVEHAKPRATMRWRRRIGHLFRLIRWKRSNKGNTCHVGAKPKRSKS